MEPTDQTVLDLLREVGGKAKPDFSGLGIIFYSGALTVPVLSLRGAEHFSSQLPILERTMVVDALAEISSATSVWHDGFHLVDSRTLALTHVAQFVAPPLAKNSAGSYPDARGGARHMTAALASLSHEVSCAAVLTSDGRVAIYRAGNCVRDEAVRP